MQAISCIAANSSYAVVMPANMGRPTERKRTAFGERLAAAREAAGLSQRNSPTSWGSRNRMALWEREPVALRPEQVAQLAAALVSAQISLAVKQQTTRRWPGRQSAASFRGREQASATSPAKDSGCRRRVRGRTAGATATDFVFSCEQAMRQHRHAARHGSQSAYEAGQRRPTATRSPKGSDAAPTGQQRHPRSRLCRPPTNPRRATRR